MEFCKKLVSSCLAGRGKSTIAVLLAILIAFGLIAPPPAAAQLGAFAVTAAANAVVSLITITIGALLNNTNGLLGSVNDSVRALDNLWENVVYPINLINQARMMVNQMVAQFRGLVAAINNVNVRSATLPNPTALEVIMRNGSVADFTQFDQAFRTTFQPLPATMEDATSAIYSMFLVDEEGTASSLRGVREVVAKHGLFCSLYTDRGSHYFFTPEAGGPVSRTVQTQFGRALKQLGIEHIAAYSPQARGRSERVFSTLQDRLPKELRLAGISTVEAANRWLSETYIADHNKLFAISAEQEGSAFVADTMGAWREILCVQEGRTVGNDNTVKWQRLSLQLPPSRLRPHFV